jgi:hypothetical protein
MMNDFAPFHSPASYPADDIYYHCIDIVLSSDAPLTGDAPVENNGMVCPSRWAMPPDTPTDAGTPPQTATDGGMPTGMTTPEPPMNTGVSGMQAPMNPGMQMGGSGATAPGGQGNDTTAPPAGGSAGQAAVPPTMTAGHGDDGGCRVTPGSSMGSLAPLVFALLALVARRRTHE